MQNGLAYLLAETGKNLDEALRLVLTALRSQPSNTAYADTVGWIYVKKKMPDAALHVLWNLVEREPENALYRYHLAMAELIKGNKMHAKATLEAALRKRPSAEEAAQIREALSGL
jgi:predicted Zn-dependent protease